MIRQIFRQCSLSLHKMNWNSVLALAPIIELTLFTMLPPKSYPDKMVITLRNE
jgi:hypothetical protein